MFDIVRQCSAGTLTGMLGRTLGLRSWGATLHVKTLDWKLSEISLTCFSHFIELHWIRRPFFWRNQSLIRKKYSVVLKINLKNTNVFWIHIWLGAMSKQIEWSSHFLRLLIFAYIYVLLFYFSLKVHMNDWILIECPRDCIWHILRTISN